MAGSPFLVYCQPGVRASAARWKFCAGKHRPWLSRRHMSSAACFCPSQVVVTVIERDEMFTSSQAKCDAIIIFKSYFFYYMYCTGMVREKQQH